MDPAKVDCCGLLSTKKFFDYCG